MSFQEKVTPGVYSDGTIVLPNGKIITAEEADNITQQINGLPINQNGIPQQIIDAVRDNKVIIIEAETGAGKTTQIPKLLHLNYQKSKIVVTQPRIIAAISNAKRISEELICQTRNLNYAIPGDLVGYRTGQEVSGKRSSLLSLNTDGTEMMRQQFSEIHPDILCLDEFHHYQIATEILAWIAKNRKKSKLIITSATLDREKVLHYFGSIQSNIPVLEIPGRTFPVTEYVGSREEAEGNIIEGAQNGEHTLVFHAGKREIEQQKDKLSNILGSENYEILELHSEIDEKQAEYIVHSKPTKTRIILATNAAEESITIPYIKRVIDYGNHKKVEYTDDGIPRLVTESITKANSKQRAGRAGRVQEGKYFWHGSEEREYLFEYPRAPIESEMLDREILLFAKQGQSFRDLVRGDTPFVHEVDKKLMNISYDRLKMIGALNNREYITPLGKDILSIPLSPYMSRMLIEGIRRGCHSEMLVFSAMMEEKSFLSKNGTWQELVNSRERFSDLLHMLDIFKLCTKTSLTDTEIGKLVQLGISIEEINALKEKNHNRKTHERRKIYEGIDLKPIGIKNLNLAKLDRKIQIIEKILKEQGYKIQIPSSKTIAQKNIHDEIATCIYSGIPFFTYEEIGERKLKHRPKKGVKKQTHEFIQAGTSQLSFSNGGACVGMPFIITQEDYENDLYNEGISEAISWHTAREKNIRDVCIVSFITKIDGSHIKEIEATQESYTRVFKTDEKETQRHKNTYERYIEIIAEEKNLSTKEFLEYVLPIFMAAENVVFKKKWRNLSETELEKNIKLLGDFFIQHKKDYENRINLNNLGQMERSFGHDTQIWEVFQSWKYKNNQGFHANKNPSGIIISNSDLFRLQNLKQEYHTVLGQLEGFIEDEDGEILAHIHNDRKNEIQKILGENPEYHTLIISAQKLLGDTCEEDHKKEIRRIEELSKGIRNERNIVEVFSYFQSLSQELEKCREMSDSGSLSFFRNINWNLLETLQHRIIIDTHFDERLIKRMSAQDFKSQIYAIKTLFQIQQKEGKKKESISRIEKSISELNGKINTTTRELEEIEEKLGKSGGKEEVENHLGKEKRKKESQLRALKGSKSQKQKQLSTLTAHNAELLQSWHSQRIENTRTIKRLREEIVELKNIPSQSHLYRTQLLQKTRKLEELKREEQVIISAIGNNFSEKLGKLQQKIESIKSAISNDNQQIQNIDKIQDTIERKGKLEQRKRLIAMKKKRESELETVKGELEIFENTKSSKEKAENKVALRGLKNELSQNREISHTLDGEIEKIARKMEIETEKQRLISRKKAEITKLEKGNTSLLNDIHNMPLNPKEKRKEKGRIQILKRKLKTFGKTCTNIIKILEGYGDHLEVFKEKMEGDRRKKLEKIPLRGELKDFFKSLFHQDYYKNVLEPRINSIIIEILSPNGKDTDLVVQETLASLFRFSHLKDQDTFKDQIDNQNLFNEYQGMLDSRDFILSEFSASKFSLPKNAEKFEEQWEELSQRIHTMNKLLQKLKNYKNLLSKT